MSLDACKQRHACALSAWPAYTDMAGGTFICLRSVNKADVHIREKTLARVTECLAVPQILEPPGSDVEYRSDASEDYD